MIDTSQDLEQQYLSALLCFLASGGEAALHIAYEVGRQAIADGLGGFEMLAIHQRCLAVALRNSRNSRKALLVVEQAGNFFAESLSPFEMAQRGFQEANAQLSKNLEDLRAAEEELRQQHKELLAAYEQREMERRRYRDLFDFAPDAYLVTDLKGRIEEANRAAGALLSLSSASLRRTRLLQFVVEDMRAPFYTWLRRLPEAGAGRPQDWQVDIQPQTGAVFPATLTVRVVRNASGRAVGLRWLLRDMTERKRIEEERAELLVREQVARTQSEAAQRFEFLAEASTLLAASLDCEAALGDVAHRAVPYMADWCLVFLAEPNNRIRLICAAHAGPAKAEAASGWIREPVLLDPQSQIVRLLDAGQAEILPGRLERGTEAIAGEPESLRFLLEQLESLLLVPIKTHGRALGLMVLAAEQPGRYRDDHLALAEDLARRCALAVDNAQLYRAVTAERDKAAEAGRAKDDFLAILGHELRNPLVPILGWARNLKKDAAVAANPVLSQGIETLERNARNILRLADDCLDLVRISERRVTLNKESLDLNPLVRGCVDALRLTAQEKGLRVATHLSSSRLWILGDQTRLEQVMTNLLINAIKYTEPGGVLSISSSRVNDHAEVEVKDTGIGIAPEFLEQVFQPFRGGRKEWLTSDAGLGLGLAIARKIVELHGGAIWAESPGLSRGSTFHLRLRLSQAEVSLPVAGLSDFPDTAQVSPMCVLLIDDQEDVADLMKMELAALGYRVLTAADGQAGLETAIRILPDVIVSDIKMPGMDGYEFIQCLRRTPELASTPVIALTGLGMKKHVEVALAAGYDAHLNKPVEVIELSELIQGLVIQRRTQNA